MEKLSVFVFLFILILAPVVVSQTNQNFEQEREQVWVPTAMKVVPGLTALFAHVSSPNRIGFLPHLVWSKDYMFLPDANLVVIFFRPEIYTILDVKLPPDNLSLREMYPGKTLEPILEGSLVFEIDQPPCKLVNYQPIDLTALQFPSDYQPVFLVIEKGNRDDVKYLLDKNPFNYVRIATLWRFQRGTPYKATIDLNIEKLVDTIVKTSEQTLGCKFLKTTESASETVSKIALNECLSISLGYGDMSSELQQKIFSLVQVVVTGLFSELHYGDITPNTTVLKLPVGEFTKAKVDEVNNKPDPPAPPAPPQDKALWDWIKNLDMNLMSTRYVTMNTYSYNRHFFAVIQGTEPANSNPYSFVYLLNSGFCEKPLPPALYEQVANHLATMAGSYQQPHWLSSELSRQQESEEANKELPDAKFEILYQPSTHLRFCNFNNCSIYGIKICHLPGNCDEHTCDYHEPYNGLAGYYQFRIEDGSEWISKFKLGCYFYAYDYVERVPKFFKVTFIGETGTSEISAISEDEYLRAIQHSHNMAGPIVDKVGAIRLQDAQTSPLDGMPVDLKKMMPKR